MIRGLSLKFLKERTSKFIITTCYFLYFRTQTASHSWNCYDWSIRPYIYRLDNNYLRLALKYPVTAHNAFMVNSFSPRSLRMRINTFFTGRGHNSIIEDRSYTRTHSLVRRKTRRMAITIKPLWLYGAWLFIKIAQTDRNLCVIIHWPVRQNNCPYVQSEIKASCIILAEPAANSVSQRCQSHFFPSNKSTMRSCAAYKRRNCRIQM